MHGCRLSAVEERERERGREGECRLDMYTLALRIVDLLGRGCMHTLPSLMQRRAQLGCPFFNENEDEDKDEDEGGQGKRQSSPAQFDSRRERTMTRCIEMYVCVVVNAFLF